MAFEFVRSSGGIDEFVHDRNGLRVLLMQNTAAPVAAFMVTYLVGSRNERAGLTGATHLLEHLMFKGTERFNKEKGTSVFNSLQRVGAQINATTWLDRTNYYSLLPSEHLALAIEIEADRMRNARIREEDLADERTVVLNELDRGENDASRMLIQQVYAAAFPAHPYGHPTIGWRSDVETMTADDLRSFYDHYYWPNNAVVSVVGAFDREDVFGLLETHFGGIPAAPHPVNQRVTRESLQRGERRITLKQAGELGSVLISLRAPVGTDPESDALDLAAVIMGAGQSSRFHRKLTDAGLSTGAFAWMPRLRDPGLFHIYAALAPDVTHERVEEELWKTLESFAEEGPSEQELTRATRQIIADEAFGRDGPFAVVARLNEAIAAGDWTLYTTFLDRIKHISAEDIRGATRRLVNRDKAIIGYHVATDNGGNQNSL